MEFKIIKVSESEADYRREELDKEYKGAIWGLCCGWNFEVEKDGKIDYLSCHWFEGTPEELYESDGYYSGYDDLYAPTWQMNGWKLTGRVMFRGYAEEYWYAEERDWCVREVDEETINRQLQWMLENRKEEDEEEDF